MKFEMSNKPLDMFNFSSLTDIVMLLLIFFLLTSQFVIQTGVKVKLPGSQNNEQTVPAKMIVSITADNKIYLGTDLSSIEELATKISNSLKTTPTENLVIRADKAVNIDMVIKVIDKAKGLGIDKFTIETEKETF